jgi:hypothetical protein
MPPSAKIDDCLLVLEALAEHRAELLNVEEEKRHRLLMAVGRVSRPERNEQRPRACYVCKTRLTRVHACCDQLCSDWRLSLERVETVELLEVQLLNAIAPFALNAPLEPQLLRQRTPAG